MNPSCFIVGLFDLSSFSHNSGFNIWECPAPGLHLKGKVDFTGKYN